jgi:hypothetical protein
MHGVIAGHAFPHEPQLELSLLVFTHVPGELAVAPQTCPLEHAHVPELQVAPEAHTCPHEPQLLVSLATHAPPHESRPLLHMHDPVDESQLSPGAHAWPHEPQLAASCITQLPPHKSSPDAHAQVPVGTSHARPDGQVPHVPPHPSLPQPRPAQCGMQASSLTTSRTSGMKTSGVSVVLMSLPGTSMTGVSVMESPKRSSMGAASPPGAYG